METEQIEITSAELVKTLVALDGRPWAEMGRARKPMTQNRLARMLKPLGIAPDNVGPENGARVAATSSRTSKRRLSATCPRRGLHNRHIRTSR